MKSKGACETVDWMKKWNPFESIYNNLKQNSILETQVEDSKLEIPVFQILSESTFCPISPPFDLKTFMKPIWL